MEIVKLSLLERNKLLIKEEREVILKSVLKIALDKLKIRKAMILITSFNNKSVKNIYKPQIEQICFSNKVKLALIADL